MPHMNLKKAILPLAGLGTRFLPWTKVVPKELLPIGNKPMIALLVDECLETGIDDICFVLSHGKESIREYFRRDPTMEALLASRGKGNLLNDLKKYDNIRFHVVYQEEQLGDGHAIFQAKEWAGDEHTAILFGDDFFAGGKTGLQQLCDAADCIPPEEWGIFFALENIPRKDTSKYGIVDVERSCAAHPRLKKIKGLVEKPDPEVSPSTLGIVGRYIIPKSTFDVLPTVGRSHGNEIRLIDALKAQLGKVPIYGYECEGKRIDTGTPEGYKEAVQILG